MEVTVVGLTDAKKPLLSAEALQAVGQHLYFAGAARHYNLISELLPANHKWIEVEIPLAPFITKLKGLEAKCLVFASGDPLFYGIANTILRELPDISLHVLPAFNSLQTLAHRTCTAYGEARIVTLTGRPWQQLDKALIDECSLIGVLTDKIKTPSAIAARLLDFGYENYKILVGSRLGGDYEHIEELTANKAANRLFDNPNCLYLKQIYKRYIGKGIDDAEFMHLEGRPKMLTKMPVRLASLAALKLHSSNVLWDIGACTGSISIEAKLQNPLLDVYSFEKRLEGRNLVLGNAKRFGAPLSYAEGNFLAVNLDEVPRPDAVFLGGYAGQMEEVLNRVNLYLQQGGRIVFNAVSDRSRQQLLSWGKSSSYELVSECTLKVDDHNPISIISLCK